MAPALIFDCHDEAYFAWRDAGVRGATLVHVDAHHDLEPGPASGLVHVGNYVRIAIEEGLIARLIWVLPRPMWDDPPTRAMALRDLAALHRGIDATVVPIDAAPGTEGPVLLDIDLDYLFTVAFDRDPARAVLDEPWRGIDDLAADLAARWPRPRLTTIAMSLTGGFTPLRWKHLARALAARLDGVSLPAGWDAAARAFDAAERLQQNGAAADARAAFARAVAADPQYRHPYRTRGHLDRAAGRADAAARAFHTALDLDPEDRWAQLGLAMLAVDAGRPGEALTWLERIDINDDRLDAWRTLCRARDETGDVAGAIAAGRRTLSLALAGAVPLAVWASNRERRLVDPDHAADHRRLAALYHRCGEAAAAAAHRQIAAAAGLPLEEPL